MRAIQVSQLIRSLQPSERSISHGCVIAASQAGWAPCAKASGRANTWFAWKPWAAGWVTFQTQVTFPQPWLSLAPATSRSCPAASSRTSRRAAGGKASPLGAQFTISKPSTPAVTNASRSSRWFSQYSGSEAMASAPCRCSSPNSRSIAGESLEKLSRLMGRTGSQGPPRRQRHDPRPDQDPGAPQAQKREGVQRVRQGGEGDVEERPQQVGVTRRLAGHRVDERRERPQRREQHERGERERNWVAGEELQP